MRLYILLLSILCINTNIYSQIKPKITTNQIQNLVVDSTRLLNDSILVYYQNGSIIGRDTISGTGGSVGGVTGSGTTNEIAYFTGATTLGSLSTGTYPSLTELSYVKGVTSAIQTQLNGKQATLTNPVTGTGTTNYLPKFTGATTLGNSLIYESGDTLVVPKFLNVDTATLYVDAVNNRVGIGNTDPTQQLTISGPLSRMDFATRNVGGISTHNIFVYDQNAYDNNLDTVNARFSFYLANPNSTNFNGNDSDGPYFFMSGIGRNSERGTISFIAGNVSNPSGSDGVIDFYTSGLNRLLIKANGDVGIGTSSPNEKLDVRGRIEIAEQTDPSQAGSGLGTIYANSSNSKLYYRDDNGNNYDLTSTATTSDSSWTNSGSVTYLTDSGDNVGIGTSTPGAKLEINAPVTSTSTGFQFRIKDGNNDGFFQVGEGSSGANAYFPAFYGISSGLEDYGFAVAGGPVSTNDIGNPDRAAIIFDALEYDVATNSYSALENTHLFSIRNYGTNAMTIQNNGNIIIDNLDDTTGVSSNVYYNTTSKELMYYTSSQRYKKNIQDYDKGINDLMKLRPVYYQSKKSNDLSKFAVGFIAEEVEEAGFNEYIDYDSDGLANSVHYSLMTAILTKAIQEQQTIITQQQTQINELLQRIIQLENK